MDHRQPELQIPTLAGSPRDGRLTGNSFAVLAIVDSLGEASSYDIKRVAKSWMGTFWSLAHTTAYDEPERLASLGLLDVQQQNNGRRRKVFRVTESGLKALQAWKRSSLTEPPVLRHEGLLKLALAQEGPSLFPRLLDWHSRRLAELTTQTPPDRAAFGLCVAIACEKGFVEILESLPDR